VCVCVCACVRTCVASAQAFVWTMLRTVEDQVSGYGALFKRC
jgi:hypothetical protein